MKRQLDIGLIKPNSITLASSEHVRS